MLKGKTVLVGVTGGIAAYKAAELVSLLIKQHANVEVIMTHNATKFITPLTFEQLTGNKVYTDTFDRNFVHHVEHISLADKADAVIVAPATANVIAKLAHGIADDMLTTTVLACTCRKLVAPAMNTHMYENPVTQDNLNRLRGYGWKIINPDAGRLACGTEGVGKLAPVEVIKYAILNEIAFEHDLIGKRVLVTAGATQESIDPVRYITNHSTGKMGYAIAKIAAMRGARTTLIAGENHLSDEFIKATDLITVIHVKSAEDMFNAVKDNLLDADIIFKAAAVADYTPMGYSDNKIKKKDSDLNIELKRTQDILAYLGGLRLSNKVICGFSMETQDLIENSREKLRRKNIDMICANNLKVEGAGFGHDTNIITMITSDPKLERLPLMSKDETAYRIISKARQILINKERN